MTITPPPRSYMWRNVARMHRMVPVRVMSSTLCHCSSVMSTSSAVPPNPALFTTTSRWPCSATRAVDHRLHLVFDGDVAHEGERSDATGQLGELVGRLPEAPFVRVAEHDRRALVETAPRGGVADAGAGRRRHQHHLAGEQVAPRRRSGHRHDGFCVR